MTETRLGYMPALDGLRAVAIVLVVLYHALPHFRYGMLGVDVFFVLSGFLITSLIAGQIRSGSFDRRRFYSRRAIRLVPALVVTVVLFAPLGMAVLPGGLTLVGAVGALLYLSPFLPITIFSHTWTLAVEEWFYLLWPLVLSKMFRDRLSLRQAAALLATACVLQQGAMISAPGSIVARPSALLAGAAFGLWWSDGGRVPRPSAVFAGGLAIVLFAAGAGPFLYAPVPYWLAVAGAVAGVGGLASGAGGFCRRALEGGPLVAIGVVSYEWYLIHAPALNISEQLWGDDSYVLVVPATLVLAFGLHHALVPLQTRMCRQLDGRYNTSRANVPVAE